MGYKFVEGITSDVMFEVESKDLAELLEQASLALFEVVCQIKKVKAKQSVEVSVEAKDEEELVHSWLANLLAESDSREVFFSKFDIKVFKKGSKIVAKGKLSGEPYSGDKSGTVVKGITYHNFKVEKTKKGYKAIVVVDI